MNLKQAHYIREFTWDIPIPVLIFAYVRFWGPTTAFSFLAVRLGSAGEELPEPRHSVRAPKEFGRRSCQRHGRALYLRSFRILETTWTNFVVDSLDFGDQLPKSRVSNAEATSRWKPESIAPGGHVLPHDTGTSHQVSRCSGLMKLLQGRED